MGTALVNLVVLSYIQKENLGVGGAEKLEHWREEERERAHRARKPDVRQEAALGTGHSAEEKTGPGVRCAAQVQEANPPHPLQEEEVLQI